MDVDLTDPFLPFPSELSTHRELCEVRRQTEARVRRLEHWRRLVTARLDLAVAAVTDLDEPGTEPVVLPLPPYGLKELLGVTGQEHRRQESTMLPRLKEALHDLDAHLEALRWHRDEAVRLLAARPTGSPGG